MHIQGGEKKLIPFFFKNTFFFRIYFILISFKVFSRNFKLREQDIGQGKSHTLISQYLILPNLDILREICLVCMVQMSRRVETVLRGRKCIYFDPGERGGGTRSAE